MMSKYAVTTAILNVRLHTMYDVTNSPNLPQVLPSGYASKKLEKRPTNFKVYITYLTWLCNQSHDVTRYIGIY